MWLGVIIAVGLIVWAVGGLIALNPLPWHIRKYWDVPGEKELRIIQAIALLLIVAGVAAFFVAEPNSFCHDLWPEMVATGGAVLGIDELNRRRSAQEYKQSIIRQMASSSNDFALEAIRIARNEGWIEDGSLIGADFRGSDLKGARLSYANLAGALFQQANLECVELVMANLKGADLTGTNLTGAILGGADLEGVDLQGANLTRAMLEKANLIGAHLRDANLTGAKLTIANLTGAILGGANFVDAELRVVNLTGAVYDNDTQWNKILSPILNDFDPQTRGAINWDELSEEEQEAWGKWEDMYPKALWAVKIRKWNRFLNE